MENTETKINHCKSEAPMHPYLITAPSHVIGWLNSKHHLASCHLYIKIMCCLVFFFFLNFIYKLCLFLILKFIYIGTGSYSLIHFLFYKYTIIFKIHLDSFSFFYFLSEHSCVCFLGLCHRKRECSVSEICYQCIIESPLLRILSN